MACALVPNTGAAGALEIIALRVVQGVGGAMLTANSTAIITDAFPPDRRGFALGVNQVAAPGRVVHRPDRRRPAVRVALARGVLGERPGGHLGHLGGLPHAARQAARHVEGIVVDWWGNLAFGVGLIALLVAITYGLQPYGGHTMGWTSPMVLTGGIGGVALLVAFCFIENRVAEPMINLRLFKIRAFAAGQAVNLLAAMSRGGLQFMLIIWLQGIWLPLHGYDFASTPLWAGIYMLPLTDRLPDRRAGVRRGVRPVRRQGVRHRRPAADGGHLRRPDPHPGQLQLRPVRRCCSRSTASAWG